MPIYYIAGFPVSDELYHHGIKGQRWGVRRYQNEDGTLTAAGKARYNVGEFGKTVKNKVSNTLSRTKQSVSTKMQSIDKEKLKKAAKIGAAVVGTAVVAYGAYKLNSVLNDQAAQEIIAKGQDRLQAYQDYEMGVMKKSYQEINNSILPTDKIAARTRLYDKKRQLDMYSSNVMKKISDQTERELQDSRRSLGKRIQNARDWRQRKYESTPVWQRKR